jgi:hypothetical protein
MQNATRLHTETPVSNSKTRRCLRYARLKTNSYTQHSFTYTDVIEHHKDLPDIVEQVAGTKRPDSTVLRCHERDQNMPWVQQEDYVIKSVWKMLFILVL